MTLLLLSTLLACDKTPRAVAHIEKEGYVDIVLAQADEGWTFAAKRAEDGADCSGEITVDGLDLGFYSDLEIRQTTHCTKTTVTETPPPDLPPGAIALDLLKGGTLLVTPVYHGTAIIQVAGKTLWIDPWSKGALADKPKADFVLITDIHQDHLDPDAIAVVATDETVFITPSAVAEKLDREVAHVLDNGQSAQLGPLTVTATPMYNNTRGPEPGKLFHDKGRGNGYLLTIGGKTVYFAGDTACTVDMKALTGIDLAFLPMNLPYTMPPEEAAECVQAFKPSRVVPYHYRGSDVAVFEKAVGDAATVELVDFYPDEQPE